MNSSDIAEHILHIPHAAALGLRVHSTGNRHCTIRVPYAEHLVGDPDTGVIHGGVITAVLDNASGMAVRMGSEVDAPGSMATLDLRIDYMRPAEPGKDLLAYAECYRITTNIAFVRATAYHDSKADPIATSVATFMLGTSNTPRS